MKQFVIGISLLVVGGFLMVGGQVAKKMQPKPAPAAVPLYSASEGDVKIIELLESINEQSKITNKRLSDIDALLRRLGK